MLDKKYEDALAIVDSGIKAVPSDEALGLLYAKSELQFQANDIAGVRKTADVMRKSGFRPGFVEWVDARILLAEEKWFDASKALYELQPKMADYGPAVTDQIAVQLGLAYEKSGRLDLAEDTYDVVLQHNPANDPAKAGKQRVRAMKGQPAEDNATSDLDEQVAKILQQPKGERDWNTIDPQLKKLAEERKLEGAALDLFWAKLMLLREDYAEARKYLVAGRDKEPKNLEIQRTAVLLLRADPSQGPDKALRLLDQVQEKFGDSPELRLDRVDCLIALNEKNRNNDKLKEKLAKLNEAPADWTEEQKVGLWNGMAGRYLAIEPARRSPGKFGACCHPAADRLGAADDVLQPGLGIERRRWHAHGPRQILNLVGSKEDSNWLYTEARRMLSLYRRGELGKESLPEIRQLTDKASRAAQLVRAPVGQRRTRSAGRQGSGCPQAF